MSSDVDRKLARDWAALIIPHTSAIWGARPNEHELGQVIGVGSTETMAIYAERELEKILATALAKVEELSTVELIMIIRSTSSCKVRLASWLPLRDAAYQAIQKKLPDSVDTLFMGLFQKEEAPVAKKRKPVGYTNEVVGDQTTKVVPVYEFTTQHQSIIAAAEQLNDAIANGFDAQRKLNELRRACKHEVFDDIEGFPNDQRYCKVCGKYLGGV